MWDLLGDRELSNQYKPETSSFSQLNNWEEERKQEEREAEEKKQVFLGFTETEVVLCNLF